MYILSILFENTNFIDGIDMDVNGSQTRTGN
jgi:hypothetical protein